MNQPALPALGRHDVIEVFWVDIYEDGNGNTDKASLYRRQTLGYFWERREDDGIPVLVTTNTLDDDPSQQGFCIYPLSVVTQVRIVKRAKKARSKKQ